MSKYSHYCEEWDYMLIDEASDEIACCMCFEDKEFKDLRQEKQDEQDIWRLNNG